MTANALKFNILILIIFINSNCLYSNFSTPLGSSTSSGGKFSTNLPTASEKLSTKITTTSKPTRAPVEYPTYYVLAHCGSVISIAPGSTFFMKLSATDWMPTSCPIRFQHSNSNPNYFFFFTFKDLEISCEDVLIKLSLNQEAFCGSRTISNQNDNNYKSKNDLTYIMFLLTLSNLKPLRSSFTIVVTSFREPKLTPNYVTYAVAPMMSNCKIGFPPYIAEGLAFYLKLSPNDWVPSFFSCVIMFQHQYDNLNYFFFFTFKDLEIPCLYPNLQLNLNQYCGSKTFSNENDDRYKSHGDLSSISLLLSSSSFSKPPRSSFTIVVTSYRLRPSFLGCSSSEFACNNGRCISKTYVCDSHNNCGDRSDENNCYNVFKCYSNEYKCRNGRCILQKYVCDGHNNCGDRSDEDYCYNLKLSTGAIIGIAIGVIFFIVIVGTISWLQRLGRVNIRIF